MLETLPTIHLRTSFYNYSREVRIAALFMIIFPPIAFLGAIAWALLQSGSFAVFVLLPFVLIVLVFPLTSLRLFVAPDALTFGPLEIEYRKSGRRRSVETTDVDRLASLVEKDGETFVVTNRRSGALFFGAGLSSADRQTLKDWLRDLANVLGIEFREGFTREEELARYVLRRQNA